MTNKLRLVGKTDTTCDPPRPLGKHGLQFWHDVRNSYGLDDIGGIELLLQACQALDRAEECAAVIDKDGAAIRWKGGIREHPLLRSELANRAFVTRTIARLGLDVEPLQAPGRRR